MRRREQGFYFLADLLKIPYLFEKPLVMEIFVTCVHRLLNRKQFDWGEKF